ncbi:MAG: hypothetical protein NXI22_27130 [bacterium]|nr:hypothetical protein [bacterium]
MSKNAFRDRQHALEEQFFHKVDDQLIAQLKAHIAADDDKKRLSEMTHVTDESLLDELMSQGLSTKTIAAVSLVPLVLVAWADGRMDKLKRDAVLEAAHDQGVAPNSAAHSLLIHWLDEKPDDQLAVTWRHYVGCILSEMNESAREILRSNTLRRADKIAQASGGVLGFGAVSRNESDVIAELESVFTAK